MSRVNAPGDSIGVVARFTKVHLAAILGMMIVYIFFYVLLPNADAAAFLAAGGCMPVLIGFPYGFLRTWRQIKPSIQDSVTAAERTMSRARNVCIAIGALALAALVFVRPMTWTLAAALGVLGLGNAISLGITFELIRRDLASR